MRKHMLNCLIKVDSAELSHGVISYFLFQSLISKGRHEGTLGPVAYTMSETGDVFNDQHTLRQQLPTIQMEPLPP